MNFTITYECHVIITKSIFTDGYVATCCVVNLMTMACPGTSLIFFLGYKSHSGAQSYNIIPSFKEFRHVYYNIALCIFGKSKKRRNC